MILFCLSKCKEVIEVNAVWRVTVVCITIIIGISNFSGLNAQSFSVFSKKAGHKKEMINKVINELNLTSEQSERILKQRNAHRKGRDESRQLLRDRRKQLRTELEMRDTDRVRIDRVAGEIKKLQARMLDERIESVLEIKEVLTPAQYEVFRGKTKSFDKRKIRR